MDVHNKIALATFTIFFVVFLALLFGTSELKERKQLKKIKKLNELLTKLEDHNPSEYHYVKRTIMEREVMSHMIIDEKIRFVEHRLEHVPFCPQEEGLREVIACLEDENKKVCHKLHQKQQYIDHLLRLIDDITHKS